MNERSFREFFIWFAIGSGGLFVLGMIGLGLFWWSGKAQTLVDPTPPPLVFPSRTPTGLPLNEASTPSAPTPPTPSGLPAGKIVYVCQVFRRSTSDQICIMNADGSGQRRLTTNDTAKHFYPTLSPDGNYVLFSSNMSGPGKYELYELNLLTNELTQLTSEIGILTSSEISPDGSQIAFMRSDGSKNDLWIMARDGDNPRPLYSQGWDPTWSPDGSRILFASYVAGGVQLMSIKPDGTDIQQVTSMPNLRGRSDWANDGSYLVTYSGTAWNRELFLFNPDGSDPRQLTPTGGNSQGPSFSPDGQWVAFTAYFDQYGDDHGCEIYIIKVDGTSLTRLTNNNYCDWQPRWGP